MFIRILNILKQPVCSKYFTFLLLLNLLSNGTAAYVYNHILALLAILLISFSSAYIESWVCMVVKPRWLSNICFVAIIVVHELLLLVDAFLIYQFQTVIHADIIDILAATNTEEACGFAATYLRPKVILSFTALMVVLNLFLWRIARWLSRKKHQTFSVFCALGGMMVWIMMLWSFTVYHNGMDIPQLHTVTRLARSLNVLRENMKKTEQLRRVCSEMAPIATEGNLPDVVVVIGESHSVYHSSLYGYELPTSVNMERRAAMGELAVFDNVVSPADFTNRAMMSVFSLDSLSANFGTEPLFPMCFRRAGYTTALYDNQYFAGKGLFFMSDKALSDIMYNVRNETKYLYDMDLVNAIVKMQSPSLYVIHLNGQHLNYHYRYPDSYEYFSANNKAYTKYGSEKERLTVAYYDNATLYNDHVLDEIIRKFGDGDCCVVYFSDHGEEVYDYRGYVGHANSSMASDRNYQLRVPLLVWMSPTYRECRPELAARVMKAVHLPVSTDDMSHLLLDLAGIDGGYLNPQRSVANPLYDKSRHRIVLGWLDYDSNQNDK